MWALFAGIRSRSAAVWFFLVLAPTSSVLPIVTEVAAEHRMYLPLACVITLVVFGVSAALNRVAAPRFARPVIVLAAAALLCAITLDRNRDYQSGERIWLDTLRSARGMPGRAQTTRRSCWPKGGSPMPSRTFARRYNGSAACRSALGLGVVLVAQRRFDEGMPHLRAAFELAPDNAEVNRNLGEAYAAQGAMAEAVRHYDAALRVRPDDVMLLNRVGWILATTTTEGLRDGSRARDLAEHAVQLTRGWNPNRWIHWRPRKPKPGSLTRQLRRCAGPSTGRGICTNRNGSGNRAAARDVSAATAFSAMTGRGFTNDGSRIHDMTGRGFTTCRTRIPARDRARPVHALPPMPLRRAQRAIDRCTPRAQAIRPFARGLYRGVPVDRTARPSAGPASASPARVPAPWVPRLISWHWR